MEEESQRRHKRRCGLTSHKLSSSTAIKASEVCQKYGNKQRHSFLFRENLFAFIGFQIKVQRNTETEETREKRVEFIPIWERVRNWKSS